MTSLSSESSESGVPHEHDWKLPEGGYFVVDTIPEQRPYHCECGAFTHDPETGEPCSTCNPDDYARRSSKTVSLKGGPFDGVMIAEPQNPSIWLRVDPPEKRAQKIAKYVRSGIDRGAFEFYAFSWTLPLVPCEVEKAE